MPGLDPSGPSQLLDSAADGEPIDAYCDRHRLDIAGRVRLMIEVCEAVAAAHRVSAAPRYIRRLSPTVNDAARAAVAFAAAQATVGEAARDAHPPITAGEDFSEMLAARPGAYAWLGTGAPRHPEGVHHNPHFDFNDDALTTGAAWWCSVALQELSA